MSAIPNLRAFLGGASVSAVVFTLLATVNAQPSPGIVDVCATPGETLRLVDPALPCSPGERRIRLKQPELDEPKPDQPDPDGRLAELDRRLQELENRDANGQLMGSRVVAPFEVVDEAGQRIFYVEEEMVTLHNGAGQPVVYIVANEHGGLLRTLSATSPLTATIGSSDGHVGVLIDENQETRLTMGRSDKGRYTLRVLQPGGKVIAGIGQSEAGSGLVIVSDAEGVPRVRMSVLSDTGAGMIAVLNAQDVGVASMSGAGNDGAGLLQLTSGSGTVMVEAGVSKDGIGVVRAGPAGFNSGIGFLGLPGSFIQGRAAQ